MSLIEFYPDMKEHLHNCQNNGKCSQFDHLNHFIAVKEIREHAESQVRRMRDENAVSLTLHFIPLLQFCLLWLNKASAIN
jgi:hypothetical protein